MKLRFAPATKRYVETVVASTPHAILLTGQVGAGLKTLAMHIGSSNGRILTTLVPESKSTALPSISVERVRELYIETRSKLLGKNFVVIDDADTMNASAQNSLLKLLEEPNESICFILTSHNPDKLLPTIRSRTQSFAVPPIDAVESKRHLVSLGLTDPTQEQRLLYVAQGLPAELSRLASKESDFKALSERVQRARQLIEGTVYHRLATCMAIAGDRQETIKLIDTVILLLRRSLGSKPDQTTITMIERMMAASDAIRGNGNVKLQLFNAVIQ